MMKTNLLDLDNDILNIIVDYVKQDNDDRMEKEKVFKHVNNLMRDSKKRNCAIKKSRQMQRLLIFEFFFNFKL